MMDPKIKQLAPVIWAEVEKAQKILLHCHYNADQDSVGSVLALGELLENLGKQVTIIKGDTELPNFTKYLPGAEKILSKNYFEIDPTEFGLFVILDSSDLDRISKVEEITFPPSLKTINIDHHASNTNFAQINLVVSSYPATAQILFDLFKEWRNEITRTMAICLITAINADTGGFRHRNTSSHSFAVAAALAQIAPDFDKIMTQVFGSKSFGATKFLGQALANAELLFGGRVVISVLDYQIIKQSGFAYDDMHNTGISTLLRDIDGVMMSFFLIEEELGVIGISSRSRDGVKYNVAEIMKHFEGGGHVVAAGAKITRPITQVKKELIDLLKPLMAE